MIDGIASGTCRSSPPTNKPLVIRPVELLQRVGLLSRSACATRAPGTRRIYRLCGWGAWCTEAWSSHHD
jgi:hypothetical protein